MHLAALDVCFSSPARTGGSGTLLVVSLFWIVRFSYSVNGIVVTSLLKLARSLKARLIITILLTLYENRTIQNKLTTKSVPDPPVRTAW